MQPVATDLQRENIIAGNAIRFEMLVLGAQIKPTIYDSTIYALGNQYRYAQLEYFWGIGYKLRLKWYKTRQFRTDDPDQMRGAWHNWRGNK